MNNLDPMGLLKKKNQPDLNKNLLRNYVQLVARNLLQRKNTIKNKEELSGMLMAHIEVRNSFIVIFGNDGYVKQIESQFRSLNKETKNTYQRKIIRSSIADKKSLNYILKKLVSHSVMYTKKALESKNEEDLNFAKGLLSEYELLCKSLNSILLKQNYSQLKVKLEQLK